MLHCSMSVKGFFEYSKDAASEALLEVRLEAPPKECRASS